MRLPRLLSHLYLSLAFVPLGNIESAFEALSMHIAGTCLEIIAIVCATLYSQILVVKFLNLASPVKFAVPT